MKKPCFLAVSINNEIRFALADIGHAENIRIQIDCDNQAGSERPTDGYRNGVGQGPVNKPASIDFLRREQAWKSIGGCYCLCQIAFSYPDFMSGAKFSCYCRKGNRKVLYFRIPDRVFQQCE